jgi:DNA polymerase-1
MERVLIVDGLNLFVSSFVVNPTMDTNGEHIGGFVGFLLSLKNIINETKPSIVVIAWDGEGGSLRRRSLYKDYKSGRKPKVNREYDFESPDAQVRSFGNQLLKVREYSAYLPLVDVMVPGLEGDDVISYIVNFCYRGMQKVIVSTDRDFFQLVGPDVCVYNQIKKSYVTSIEVVDFAGVIPENFIFYKAIAGDTSDNIKGIKGIGKKTLVKLFPFLSERASSLEEIIDHAERNKTTDRKYCELAEQKSSLENNIKIMQLTNPLMDPRSSGAIRAAVDSAEVRFNQTGMMLRLINDGISIKSRDLFTSYREQYHRMNQAFRNRSSDV